MPRHPGLDDSSRRRYLPVVPEPFDAGTAKALIRRLLTGGLVTFGTHAEKELAKDDLCRSDVVNVLRAGAASVNCHDGTHWRYTVETQQICTIILFREDDEGTETGEPQHKTEIRVVTAWRK